MVILTANMKQFYSPLFVISSLVILSGLFVVISNTAFFHTTHSIAQTSIDQSISRAQAVVETHPPLIKPYIALASLYLQKIRETSDASYYTKIDELMNTAQQIDPKDGDVLAIRASVALGRHDFKKGYIEIQKALALNTSRSAYWGLKGDAEIELGLYKEAVQSFQKMVDLRPDFSSWSRIAYIRELYGTVDGAKSALTSAISSGSNYPENIAWAYVEQGKLDMRSNPTTALADFGNALTVLPSYTQAMEGIGKAEFALGNSTEAETYFMRAYTGLPLAQYAVDLADLYSIRGDTTKSKQHLALAQVAYDTSRASGVNTDLEESLFMSDHDIDLAQAVEKARRAYMERPSVYGADYLAWALYKNGAIVEASQLSPEALRLGTVDPLILYHQGLIARALGDMIHAKAYLTKSYELNPHFSLLYAADLKKSI